jgi:Flp pilus assembly protein CpaB
MRLIIMFIAIALAAGAFFITVHFTAKTPEQAQSPVVEPRTQMQEVPTVDIYTAKQDITIGSVITPDMLDLHPWPKNLLLPDMVVVDPSHSNDIVKMIVRTPFQKGEPIIMNKLANANDPSFLASSLNEGMRLVTIHQAAGDRSTGSQRPHHGHQPEKHCPWRRCSGGSRQSLA